MKRAIVIAGATASGKTDLAIKIATHFNCPIINADSRQCFVEMNIGTAKPTKNELKLAKHFFVNTHSILEHTTFFTFFQYVSNLLNNELKDCDTIVIAGGTGLYLKALIEGINEIPVISSDIRFQIENDYKNFGIDYLIDFLKNRNDDFLKSTEIKNPLRVKRAVEVQVQYNKSITDFFSQQKINLPLYFEKYAIHTEKSVLIENINQRVDTMINNGLIEEANILFPYRLHKNLNTVGYQELFDFFEGKSDLKEAIDLIKIHTRQYAKRQITWFKNQNDFKILNKENILSNIIL